MTNELYKAIIDLENLQDSNCYAKMCPSCKQRVIDSLKEIRKIKEKEVNNGK